MSLNSKNLISVIIFWVIFLSLAYSQPTNVIDTVAEAKVIQAVELISIPEQSAVDIQKLRLEYAPLINNSILTELRPEIDSIQKEIAALSKLSDQLLNEQNPFEYYESLTLRWSRTETKIKEPEKELNKYAVSLEELKNKLIQINKKWNLTLKVVMEEDISEEINQRVKSTIFKFDSLALILNDSLANTLNAQNDLTNYKLKVSEYLLKLRQGKQTQLNQLLVNKEDYLWNELFKKDTVDFSYNNSRVLEYNLEDSREFLKSEASSFIKLGIFFFLMLAGIFWIRSRVNELRRKELEELDQSLTMLRNPISLAFMFTFISTAVFLPILPYVVKLVYSLVFVLPFLFIYRKIVTSKLRLSLYYFVFIFLVGRFSTLFFLSVSNNRWFILLETLMIGAFFVWFIKNKNNIKPTVGSSSYLFNFISFTTPFYTSIIIVSLIANIIGYDNLSQVANDGIILSIIVGLILVLSYLSIKLLFYLFLKTNLALRAKVVQKYSQTIFTWFLRLFVFFSTYLWFRATLREFLSWNIISDWGIEIWNRGYQFGQITVSMGGVINFFLIIIGGWMVSKIVEVLLRDELLSRFNLSRGIPMAVSSITQYVLVLLGFILAMAYVGFDLSSLGLLAGALGVGIGFGLQGIIANFISGLILVFERPITVGDTVTIDNLMGTVTSIGIRSSIIRLYDESEVIVPNTELISNKVTNWSLSNNVRRRKIVIHTTLESNPDEVLKILMESARAAEDTLENPAPIAYFNGIEDQAFQFNLYYWLTDNLFQCDSDVNTNVIKGLKENKVEFLVPKKVELKQ